jgi:hypothetical protein
MKRLMVMLLAGGLSLAACGGSSNSSSTGSTKRAAVHGDFLAFSVCMRAHGVSNFPDPPAGGGIQIGPNSGLNPASPTFQSAQTACKHLLPGGGPSNRPDPAEKATLLKLSACMRSHGISGFPDPTTRSGGGGLPAPGGPAVLSIDGYEFKLPSGVGPQSPAFNHAMSACGGPGPPGGK